MLSKVSCALSASHRFRAHGPLFLSSASINGTASVRGLSNSSISTMASLGSVDDLGLRTSYRGYPTAQGPPAPNAGLGFAPFNPSESSSFQALRNFANKPLARRISQSSRPRYAKHGPSSSDAGVAFSRSSFDHSTPIANRMTRPLSSAYQSSGGPTFQVTQASPLSTPKAISNSAIISRPVPPAGLGIGLPPRWNSNEPSPSSSRTSSMLSDEIDHGIERSVHELAGAPYIPGQMRGASASRRAVSEGSTAVRGSEPEDDGSRSSSPSVDVYGSSLPTLASLPSILEISKRPDNLSCLDCKKPSE